MVTLLAVHPRDLRRRIFTGIFLLVLIWIGLGVWSAIKGVRAALDARDGIDLLLEEYEPEDIARGEADAALADVRDDFRTAASELGGWELGPARFLPVVGRQLRSGAELSEAGAELLDIGLVLTSELSVLADELEGGGELPAALRQLARPLAELRDRAERIDFGPEESLVGVLASARREAVQRHFELLDTLTRAADGATGFAAFLEGPSTYLLFAANTSQMQSGTGGLLSMGHPIGPTGAGQVCEVTRQLRAEAGVRQQPDARLGVAHMVGVGAVCVMHVLEAPQ